MRVLSLIVVAALFAGCTAPSQSGEPVLPEVVGIDVPAWQPGDYWTFRASVNGQETFTATHIVTAAVGGDYVVDTDLETLALFNARSDVSYLGPIRMSDLAGSQGTTRVTMFSWPLEDGKKWPVTWDGEALQATARQTGPGEFAIVAARSDGSPAIEYQFSESKRWFTALAFLDGNGTAGFRLDLAASGTSYQGEYVRYRVGTTHNLVGTVESSGMRTQEFAAEWTELGLRLSIACAGSPQGMIAVGLNSPTAPESPLPMTPVANEPEWGAMHDCATADSSAVTDQLANPGGAWEIGFIVGANGGQAELVLEERDRQVLTFP